MSEITPTRPAPARGSATPPTIRRVDSSMDFPDWVHDKAALAEYQLGPWTLELPWHLNPLPANGPRGNYYAHAKKVKMVRRTVWALATAAKMPPQERVTVELTYFVRDRRRRDVDNLVPLLKPIKDGLVDAGLVRDDTPDIMATPMPTIVLLHPAAAPRPFFHVTITPWTEVAA